jgi:hypothetical protein
MWIASYNSWHPTSTWDPNYSNYPANYNYTGGRITRGWSERMQTQARRGDADASCLVSAWRALLRAVRMYPWAAERQAAAHAHAHGPRHQSRGAGP